MRRAETLAWSALLGLLVIAAILLAGGVMYNTTPFWAGMMVALGQALVVGLAGYGLRLARQARELEEIPVTTRSETFGSGFRMSMGDEGNMSGGAATLENEPHAKTLDIGFQRLLVIVSASLLIGLSLVIIFALLKPTFSWASAHPDQPFPIAGSLGKPVVFNELALVIGLGAAAIYTLFYFLTRVRRETIGYGEAVNSTFTLGISGMVALGIASILAYLGVAYAAEIAGSIMAGLLLLQGLELFVNGLRSYSGLEEIDQDAVDLHELPLIPMLSSFWLNGLKMLFAQSVGISRNEERGVIGRMMPRVIVASIILWIFAGCIRIVQPGQVAVLERLGSADIIHTADGKVTLGADSLLQPGLHLTFPWPIDNLVRIPTATLQFASVGAEMHPPETTGNGKELDFQFWTIRGQETPEQDAAAQFVTGDAGSPQMLETYVGIWWRVSDPAKFYTHISHSDFFEHNPSGTTALPAYDALVQQAAAFAVTRTFAIHSLEQIMIGDRKEVEQHCLHILQDKLDAADSGIFIEDLTIKDLHPPYGFPTVQDATVDMPDHFRRGPAAAYENVVSCREQMEAARDTAMADQVQTIQAAKGEAATEISQAESYQSKTVATAEGEAARMTEMMKGWDTMSPASGAYIRKLAKLETMYQSLKDALAPVNKVVVDPRVKDVQLWQTTNNGMIPRPPGQ